jgi:hypothetical protein
MELTDVGRHCAFAVLLGREFCRLRIARVAGSVSREYGIASAQDVRYSADAFACRIAMAVDSDGEAFDSECIAEKVFAAVMLAGALAVRGGPEDVVEVLDGAAGARDSASDAGSVLNGVRGNLDEALFDGERAREPREFDGIFESLLEGFQLAEIVIRGGFDGGSDGSVWAVVFAWRAAPAGHHPKEVRLDLGEVVKDLERGAAQLGIVSVSAWDET